MCKKLAEVFITYHLYFHFFRPFFSAIFYLILLYHLSPELAELFANVNGEHQGWDILYYYYLLLHDKPPHT